MNREDKKALAIHARQYPPIIKKSKGEWIEYRDIPLERDEMLEALIFALADALGYRFDKIINSDNSPPIIVATKK